MEIKSTNILTPTFVGKSQLGIVWSRESLGFKNYVDIASWTILSKNKIRKLVVCWFNQSSISYLFLTGSAETCFSDIEIPPELKIEEQLKALILPSLPWKRYKNTNCTLPQQCVILSNLFFFHEIYGHGIENLWITKKYMDFAEKAWPRDHINSKMKIFHMYPDEIFPFS